MADRLTLIGAAESPAVRPPPLPLPGTLQATGLNFDLVMQLVLKTLFFSGELTGGDLAKRLGVVFGVIEPALDFLKVQRHCEVVGGTLTGGASYRYRMTLEGRGAASHFLQQNHYVGAAPVPLAQYRRYMDLRRSVRQPGVNRTVMRAALSHMVLSDTVLDELGPAIDGGHSLFIYGSPGNGKTAMANAIRDLLPDDVMIPHALEVEGAIIRLFDPVSHEALPDDEPDDERLSLDLKTDRRWVMCRRPLVKTGGELALDALDLNFDPRLGFYRAPLQLIANGGVLVIDDFGRQRCEPHHLLNRWMVPLESGVDHLTLQSGLKFEVPFHVFVAFATNLKPSALVDEAFLRRVQYKVFAENPSDESFALIFERSCRDRGLAFDKTLVDHLLERFYRPKKITPRACHPRDLIHQALLLAGYRNEPRVLTADLLQDACASYFVQDRE